jgi:hypothetical protein
MASQGHKANANGRKLEDKVQFAVTKFLPVDCAYYSRTSIRENILLKNVPYTSIYANSCRSEFVLNYKGRSIRIECKTQHSSGSCSEKLPYLFYNFRDAIPEQESIIVITGKGFRFGCKEWLYKKSYRTRVSVFSYMAFVEWLRRDCPKKKLPILSWYRFRELHRYLKNKFILKSNG